MNELLVKWIPVTELHPHPKNPNRHSKDQIDRLVKLINYQGWRHPIIVSERSGYIVAGHGRLEAALKMGLTTVPVSSQKFDDDEQEYAFVVSDNAIASWAELDLAGIDETVKSLGEFDHDLLGLLATPNFIEPDPKGVPEDKESGLNTCPNCGVLIDG